MTPGLEVQNLGRGQYGHTEKNVLTVTNLFLFLSHSFQISRASHANELYPSTFKKQIAIFNIFNIYQILTPMLTQVSSR